MGTAPVGKRQPSPGTRYQLAIHTVYHCSTHPLRKSSDCAKVPFWYNENSVKIVYQQNADMHYMYTTLIYKHSKDNIINHLLAQNLF